MKARRLRTRVRFEKPVPMTDEIGNAYDGWELVLTRWGDLIPQRGREQVEAGRLESSVPGVLQIRWDSETSRLDASHRAIIETVPYQIISVLDPDMLRRTIEMVVARGVAI